MLLCSCTVICLLSGSVTAAQAASSSHASKKARIAATAQKLAGILHSIWEPGPEEAAGSTVPEDLAEAAALAEAEKKITTREGPAGKIDYIERSEDSQLIVEMVLDDQVTVFDQALPIYQVNETVLVPLGKFAEDVGFPIAVDTSRGTAEGWFLSKENTFRFYSPYKSVEIAGKTIPLRRGFAETHLDDIYVSLDLLNSWFPIGLTLNYNELRLYMKPLTDLPVQEQAKRRGRWETAEKQQQQPGLDYDPKDVIKLPARKFAAPAIQVSHGISRSMTPESSPTSFNTSVNATTDLFGMDARASVGFSAASDGREEIQNIQFNLSKEDLDGKLLGPLKATKYELGDVNVDNFPLAAGGSGRGFTVSNQPYNFVTDATNFRIKGFATAGWDIEIFQAGELLAFSTIGPEGRYDFPTLPLRQGFNLFKIVLYGPSGEKEERYDRFYLGQSMVPKGEFYYSAGALQSSTPILDVSTSPPPTTPSTVSLSGEYGVNKYLSASAGIFNGPFGNTVLQGAGFGLRSSTKNLYAQTNIFLDKSGGQSASGLVTGNLTETLTYNVRDTMHRNYEPGIRTTTRSTAVQVSNLFDFDNEIIPSMNMTVQVGRDRSEAGQVKTSFINRIATNILGLSLSNEMEYDKFNDNSADINNGRLSLRVRTPVGMLHSDWSYIFYPTPELTTASADLQTNLSPTLTMTSVLSHSFGNAPTTTLRSGLDWQMNKVRLGLTGSIDNNQNKQIGATVAYNLVPRTLYGNYALADVTEDISSGRIIIRPFVDENGNDLFDKGEPTVKDIRFRNMLRGTTSRAAKDGTVILSGLTPSLANRIVVDEETITDIYLTPKKKQLLILGKSGVNGPVDFPFSKLGEISGMIIAVDPATGGEIPLNEVQMVLLDKAGNQAAEAYSESDGYFSFASIPVGDYEMFFPVSETLQKYYAGNGQGPKVSISFDSPELSELKLVVGHDTILMGGSPEGAAVAKPEPVALVGPPAPSAVVGPPTPLVTPPAAPAEAVTE